MRRHQLRGNAIPDGHLAALAIEHGVAVCSADTDFTRFDEVRWINQIAGLNDPHSHGTSHFYLSSLAEWRARLEHQERNEGRRVEVADHLRCAVTRSLAVPATGTGSRDNRFGSRAG